jgi:hypothetical protein
MWIERYPDIHKQILDYGHEIINHTYSHPYLNELNSRGKFADLSYKDKEYEISRCHMICEKILKYSPVGFRSPHLSFTPDIYPILKAQGYKYSSSTLALKTHSFGLPFKVDEEVIEFPLSPCPQHLFTTYDTYHVFRSTHPIHKLMRCNEKKFLGFFNFLISLAKKIIVTSTYYLIHRIYFVLNSQM